MSIFDRIREHRAQAKNGMVAVSTAQAKLNRNRNYPFRENFNDRDESPSINYDAPKASAKSKKFKLTTDDVFKFVHQQYGGDITKVMDTVSILMSAGVTSGLIKNPKAKNAIKIAQGIVGTTMIGYDFYQRIKRYVEENYSEPSQVTDRRHEYIKDILGNAYSGIDFLSSKNIVLWILNKPETSVVKILKYYDFDEYKEIPFFADNIKNVAILIEFPNNQLGLWTMNIVKFGEFVSCNSSELQLCGLIDDDDILTRYSGSINKDYVSSLSIDKNTLRFNGYGNFMGLEPVPRKFVNTHIYNFNFDGFLKEIKTVLDCKRRRAYAFVGRPGVGKSSIIRKIESAITAYPMVYFSANEFENSETLHNSFQMLKSIGPCIVVIEDLDSYGLGTKNYISGTFLECIDEVNENSNMVLLVTINETSQVHNSIINRPGRFDRIIEVTSPQSTDEIVEVMNYKINKLKDEYLNGVSPFTVTHHELIDECFERKYTQAEIVNAIIEEVILNIKTDEIELPVYPEYFYNEMKKAIQNLENSKEALLKYGDQQ